MKILSQQKRFAIKICLVFCVVIVFHKTLPAQETKSYCGQNPEACEQAALFYQKHKQLVTQIIAEKHGFEPLFLYAIVAPEVANFSIMQNHIETAAVELFYIDMGSDYANFSLGYFQMKPAFIETLEQKIKKHGEPSPFRYITQYSQSGEKAIRKERLKRLKSLKWQLHYLCAFYHLACFRFKEHTFVSQRQRLRYFATLYNTGLDATPKTLAYYLEAQSFPARTLSSQFNYATIAAYFYQALR